MIVLLCVVFLFGGFGAFWLGSYTTEKRLRGVKNVWLEQLEEGTLAIADSVRNTVKEGLKAAEAVLVERAKQVELPPAIAPLPSDIQEIVYTLKEMGPWLEQLYEMPTRKKQPIQSLVWSSSGHENFAKYKFWIAATIQKLENTNKRREPLKLVKESKE